jgi:hypothetical protein
MTKIYEILTTNITNYRNENIAITAQKLTDPSTHAPKKTPPPAHPQ